MLSAEKRVRSLEEDNRQLRREASEMKRELDKLRKEMVRHPSKSSFGLHQHFEVGAAVCITSSGACCTACHVMGAADSCCMAGHCLGASSEASLLAQPLMAALHGSKLVAAVARQQPAKHDPKPAGRVRAFVRWCAGLRHNSKTYLLHAEAGQLQQQVAAQQFPACFIAQPKAAVQWHLT